MLPISDACVLPPEELARYKAYHRRPHRGCTDTVAMFGLSVEEGDGDSEEEEGGS
jgi:hypothetical protein